MVRIAHAVFVLDRGIEDVLRDMRDENAGLLIVKRTALADIDDGEQMIWQMDNAVMFARHYLHLRQTEEGKTEITHGEEMGKCMFWVTCIILVPIAKIIHWRMNVHLQNFYKKV
uniref:Uncharacterized protein n=1 Tax=Paramoeba aestuarina TaxID=180227 RepID=A0A7S4LAR6_9EUKA|mmetsp:Transcript_33869/g.53000  ORF Transcript_33869/g.53000 Transcript_33869/m.53000 type:complete len:114 (+) Transcript_33869:85-426(+)